MNTKELDRTSEEELRQALTDCCIDEDSAEFFVDSGELNQMIKVIRQYTDVAILRKAVSIHDDYWHSQRYVDDNGIGKLALSNRQWAEKALAALQYHNQEEDGYECM